MTEAATKLVEWLAQSGLKKKAFAARIGVNVSTLRAYESGARKPLMMAAKMQIQDATDGAVPVEAWEKKA